MTLFRKTLFLIIDEHWRASRRYICIAARHRGPLDSFANATARQINEGFSDGLFSLFASYRRCPNILTAVALDFIAIDFWVSLARLYAIRLDFLALALSPSRSRDYFCNPLINRHVSPESVATRKGDFYPWHDSLSVLHCIGPRRADCIFCSVVTWNIVISIWNFSPPVMTPIPHHH